MSPLIKKIHRIGGLTIAVFILYYCVTGVILNHRKSFDYFVTKEKTSQSIDTYDTRDLWTLINFYKKRIGREDDPKVIRINREGTIEFLYGSHGSTTYVISPHEGNVTKIVKNSIEPISQLNNFHKAYKTSVMWATLSDVFVIVVLVVITTGLLLFTFKLKDWMILIAGVLVLIFGMVIG